MENELPNTYIYGHWCDEFQWHFKEEARCNSRLGLIIAIVPVYSSWGNGYENCAYFHR